MDERTTQLAAVSLLMAARRVQLPRSDEILLDKQVAERNWHVYSPTPIVRRAGSRRAACLPVKPTVSENDRRVSETHACGNRPPALYRIATAGDVPVEVYAGHQPQADTKGSDGTALIGLDVHTGAAANRERLA